MLALLEQIKKSPPVNIVSAIQRQVEAKEVEESQDKHIEETIGKMQEFVEGESKVGKIKSKRGRILGVMRKKTEMMIQGKRPHDH